ncbi:MAG: hypothetical protein ACRELT_04000, partial [Longimicrobiales bacterium]
PAGRRDGGTAGQRDSGTAGQRDAGMRGKRGAGAGHCVALRGPQASAGQQGSLVVHQQVLGVLVYFGGADQLVIIPAAAAQGDGAYTGALRRLYT